MADPQCRALSTAALLLAAAAVFAGIAAHYGDGVPVPAAPTVPAAPSLDECDVVLSTAAAQISPNLPPAASTNALEQRNLADGLKALGIALSGYDDPYSKALAAADAQALGDPPTATALRVFNTALERFDQSCPTRPTP